MKVLVCGGRDFDNFIPVDRELSKLKPSLVIEGGAKGADSLARDWAYMNFVPFLEHPANWPKYGNSAGPIRNVEMLNIYKPDLVVAFPGGKGTAHMVKIAREAGIEVIEVNDEA